MTQNDNEFTAPDESGRPAEQPSGDGGDQSDPRLVRAGELLTQGDADGARAIFKELTEDGEARAEGLHGLGLLDMAAGDLDGAVEKLEQALALKPDSPAFLNNLAVAQMRARLYYPAKNTLAKALELNRDSADAWANMGLVMLSLGEDPGETDLVLGRALGLQPGHSAALEHMAELRRRQNRHQERAVILKALAESRPDRAAFFLSQAAESCLTLNDYGAAGPLLEKAAALAPDNPDLARLHAEALGLGGRPAPAKEELRRAAALPGGRDLWRWSHLGYAPRCFENSGEIDDYRQWLADQLEEASAESPAFDLEQLSRDGFALPFEMSFHGRLCREPREKFAALFAKTFESFTRPEIKPADGRPLRIGFVAAGGAESGFWRAMGQFAARLDHRRFERAIFIGPAGPGFQPPPQMAGFRPVVLPPDLARAADMLRQARCDVMYYWRAGDDPFSLFLPMTRPAPVQCTSWGCHGTSGLADIDYYLSWDGAEAPGAEAHYTERLIRLPAPPVLVPEGPKGQWVDRRSLGLPVKGTFYFAPHRPAMYQPVFDELLAGILEADGEGFVAMILDHRWPGASAVRRRLRRRLGEAAWRRVFFMPTMPAEAYLRYMTAADMVLESPVHSGEIGSLDALSRGIPCVTLEGGLMVRRQTAARYREMGLEELIAADEQAYVALALKMAREADYRHHVSKIILENKGKIVNRADTVAALENFFESAGKGELNEEAVVRH